MQKSPAEILVLRYWNEGGIDIRQIESGKVHVVSTVEPQGKRILQRSDKKMPVATVTEDNPGKASNQSVFYRDKMVSYGEYPPRYLTGDRVVPFRRYPQP